ncbi:capsular polysaccharide biosynthesis protein [Psychrobacter sp.]|uniref:capsular polysaccharide biosynthesis protein n=1 Tax=Psychrobacter sp. TaxID=56811 RepID=UPI0026471117|nr:capsular polysaccharide biosynthesis protein [Psychrobacter sp.]MDN6275058.1 capsular polysaccharide biosynthesis protein [Psychrobacter sp.]MDN6307588.1 capsular polysaccharide biosynthesis protein [Psychrobacter sp.]
MAGSVVDDVNKSANSDADDTLSLPSTQHLVPNRLAVVGRGMRRNNLLLSQVLQADIQRWYPWSGLPQKVKEKLPLPKTINNHLSPFLSSYLSITPPKTLLNKPAAFIGWGHKKSYQRAFKIAKRQNIKALSVEDGFLRSLDSGLSSRHGLSVVVDDIGIYFDLTQSSRLERLVVARSKGDATPEKQLLHNERAKQLMARICDARLSKYNAVMYCPSLDALVRENSDDPKRQSPQSHILLIDQVAGDASIKGAGADRRQFKRMLKTACRNHPDAHIWIKAHPASKSGYLTSLKLPKNVQVLTQAVNPIALLAQVEHVYTVSSHMGFEALMLGKEVHCFGVNWYCGWGLTDDSGAPKNLLRTVSQRRQSLSTELLQSRKNPNSALFPVSFSKQTQATLETLFYSAYIDYSHYVDPSTKQACDIDTAIEWIITNRYWQSRLAGALMVYEFSRWKLPFVKDFVDLPRTDLFIKPKPRLKNLLHPDHFRVNYKRPLLVWGLAKRQYVQNKRQSENSDSSVTRPSVYCMEDGFVRSNGLGATLLAPLSVVIDKQGIYYDATQPSDLETLLVHCDDLTPQQRQRVRKLQAKLLSQRVSKYNVGADIDGANGRDSSWVQTAKVSGKPRILIVGQVEDDLSVRHCGSAIQKNSALILRVRQCNPDAYLIYKPHPDVEAGLRAGKVGKGCLREVDAVAYDTAMPDCLERVDEVHTISSLTGFEALLRGLSVTCYGVPFYAGWGLTTDMDAQLLPKSDYLARRRRDVALSLEQLLYCTLIRYPLYRLPGGYGLAQVEQVIDYLYSGTDNNENANSNPTASHDTKSDRLIGDTANLSIKTKPLSQSLTAFKRQAATRFMQQRHQWQKFGNRET